VFAAEWEAAAKNVPASTRSVIIRTGIVLARDGGVLARMLPIFELFAGAGQAQHDVSSFRCAAQMQGTCTQWQC
jgi:NAD dependent epimerase/dehydratase family enzyme